jgi:TIR domain
MPHVFINYRTGNGEHAAVLIDRVLSDRFGSEQIFRASKSIKPGETFDAALLSGVRRSGVLLALIGPGWLDARDAEGLRRLDDPADWIRREIVTALDCGVPVIPILLGKVEPVRSGDLPRALSPLARRQYLRLDSRRADTDLDRICNEIAALVPELRAATAGPVVAQEASTRHGGVGDIHGAIGTVIASAHGPINTGSGHQFNLGDRGTAPLT